MFLFKNKQDMSQLIKSIFPPLHTLAGWTGIRNVPKEDYICVFGHTSYFDGTILLLIYATLQINVSVIANPGLKAWYYMPFRALINVIYAPRNENRNNNTTDVIANQFDVIRKANKKKNNNNNILMISPKGTIVNKPWRSGYYYIAKLLGIRIFPLIYSTSTRIIEFGEPVDPKTMTLEECSENLQRQISKHHMVNNKNVEYELISNDCPYESFCCYDFCCVSLLSFFPYLFALFYEGNYYLFVSCLSAIVVSWKYHIDKEGTIYAKTNLPLLNMYQKTEAYYCGSIMASHILYMFMTRGLSMTFYMLFMIGYLFYYMSTPRGHDINRGKYVIAHGFYHILFGITSFSMLGY